MMSTTFLPPVEKPQGLIKKLACYFFTSSIPDHLDQIKAAAAQWNQMNWLRSLLGFVGVLFSFKGLDTYYQTTRKREET
jgi:hypothetical protein